MVLAVVALPVSLRRFVRLRPGSTVRHGGYAPYASSPRCFLPLVLQALADSSWYAGPVAFPELVAGRVPVGLGPALTQLQHAVATVDPVFYRPTYRCWHAPVLGSSGGVDACNVTLSGLWLAANGCPAGVTVVDPWTWRPAAGGLAHDFAPSIARVLLALDCLRVGGFTDAWSVFQEDPSLLAAPCSALAALDARYADWSFTALGPRRRSRFRSWSVLRDLVDHLVSFRSDLLFLESRHAVAP